MINDNFKFLEYMQSVPKDDAVFQMIADTFVEQIRDAEKHIITRVFNEYSRATQELDKPPTAESLYKALKFAKAIRNLEDLIQSVCAIADGGFSFRIQGINGIYYIDVDIYNDETEYVLLHKRNDSVTNAYNLNFTELLARLSDTIGWKSEEKPKLEWQENPPEKLMTWYEANEYADSLGNGWRLPTIKELEEAYVGKVEEFYFRKYWSLSVAHLDNLNAWYVDFSDGVGHYYYKAGRVFVRCVREVK